jgi:WD40 repeat protein
MKSPIWRIRVVVRWERCKYLIQSIWLVHYLDFGYIVHSVKYYLKLLRCFEITQRPITMIPAHDSPLAALSFDWHGTKLATASEKGTVIRVFTVPQGKRLFEFRRGLKRNATIYSLSFSPDSLFLSASSHLETIHIFRLDSPKEKYKHACF